MAPPTAGCGRGRELLPHPAVREARTDGNQTTRQLRRSKVSGQRERERERGRERERRRDSNQRRGGRKRKESIILNNIVCTCIGGHP